MVEQVFPLLEPRALVEVGDVRILLEPGYDLFGLIRQTVAFIRSGVVRLVKPVGEHVCHDYDGEHHQDIKGRIRAIFCLSCFEPLTCHLGPPTHGFHGARGKEKPQEDPAEIEDDVLRFDHSFGEGLEVGND